MGADALAEAVTAEFPLLNECHSLFQYQQLRYATFRPMAKTGCSIHFSSTGCPYPYIGFGG